MTEVIVLLVAQVQTNWNELCTELVRWLHISREITPLSHPTARY